ncbi:hypothetical protein ACIQWA_36570 [Kitasatospora sp. NPDC098652]|uniref:hypothetical protein n=1 Tax=Kitasatospora sp. NPDC098652 TaxID=3364095 RepID=UPI00382A56A6
MNTHTTDDIEQVFAGLTAQRHSGLLDPDDAYDVLLRFLAHARTTGQTRTTADELHTAIHQLDGSHVFGGRGTLRTLLRNAAADREIRITATGHILLRSDAPSDGGPEHTWIRLETSRGAEVEIVGADPWPDYQQQAPGPAWWRCTGCRMSSGRLAQDLDLMRIEATGHARDCFARPAPAACTDAH